MGLFGKKSKNYNDDGHNNNLFTDEDDFLLPFDDSPFNSGVKNKATAPHALTADEVIGAATPETIEMKREAHPVPNSVYERMKEQRQLKEEAVPEDDYVPSWATAVKKEEAVAPAPVVTKAVSNTHAESVSDTYTEPETETPAETTDDFLQRCRMAVDLATTGVHYDNKAFEVFANDDYYKPLDAKEAAKEVDVDDIIRRIKSENNLPEVEFTEPEPEAPVEETVSPAESILKSIIKPVDTPSAPQPKPEVEPEEIPMESPVLEVSNPEDVAAFEDEEDVIVYTSSSTPKVNDDPEIAEPEITKPEVTHLEMTEPEPEVSESNELENAPKKIEVQVEVIPSDSESDIMHTDTVNANKTYGKIYHGVVMGRSERGDVQLDKVIDAAKENAVTAAAITAATAAAEAATDKTVVFGSNFSSIGSAISKRADDDYDDFDDDYDYDESTDAPYYETEPKELAGIKDYNDLNDSAKLRTGLMAEHSTRFTFTVLSFITTALIAIISSPLSAFFGTLTVGYINLLLLVATILFNLNIFTDLKRVIDFKIGFDSCVSVAALMMLIQNLVSIFAFDGRLSAVAGAATMLMAVNSLAKTLKLHRTLKGLETIATSEVKNAVTAAAGAPAATIASGAVDGEVIALSGRETVNVRNYLKNCGYESPFDLKAKILLVAGIVAALLIGLISGIFTDTCTGLTLAALTLCACFPACAIFTAELPMYFACSKLNRYGAMLAGFKGAYDLNLSNVLAIKTSDLFPEGSITLYDMKPLGQNEIGHSLIEAAAVANAAKSPLAPIFSGIIGSVPEKDMPNITGVQYEDKMGITGWIGDRTILIGNRNLMQGHNVSVPPSSVDQKILRAGYFPVYVACDGVPCLLFIVKYEADPNIAAELQRVCSTGMTVVIYPEDPNASDMMLCDYFGLPNDAIKVMRHNGRVAYERATVATDSTSAPASFGKSICGFFSAVSSAINMKNTMTILTVLYAIAAVLACILLIYFTVIGKLSIVTSFTFTLFQLVFGIISAIMARTVRR